MGNIDLVQWLAFGVLSILMLGSAVMVVTSRNLFHGALWLLISLFGVAGLFVMLAAPFLAAVQVLVYMGAIVILIIFAIMLTQRMMEPEGEMLINRWAVGLAMSALAFLVIGFILVLASGSQLLAGKPVPDIDSQAALVGLGKALVDPQQYTIPFILASLLLTAAMIGAIVIARDEA